MTRQHGTASMVGEVLGSYRLEGQLGVGGMGTVYRAHHELLERPAAVKLMHPELSNDALLQRFFNEARAASAIRHPGIIDVYDFGYTEAGDAYLVMELLDGVPLGKAIAERGPMPELAAATIARGVASALKAAHSKGIFHRDLKPDNIFLVPDRDGLVGERVKVLDFGIAKLADPDPTTSGPRYTRTGMLIGTPLYMAPEQARAAADIDHRADLYSLGCILYELLVGRPPFTATGAGEIIAMQMFTPPEPPSARRAGISPEMDRLVMRLLEKEPDQRFESAAELVTALAAIGAPPSSSMTTLAGAPAGVADSQPRALAAEVRRVEPTEQIPRRRRRSMMPFMGGGLLVAATAAIVAIAVSRAREEEGRPVGGGQVQVKGAGAAAAAAAAMPRAAVPPTAAAVPPTAAAVPPTAAAVPPTAAAVPPTAAAVPPTAAAVPPTAGGAPAPRQQSRPPRAGDRAAPLKPMPVAADPAPAAEPPKPPGPRTDKGAPIEADLGGKPQGGTP